MEDSIGKELVILLLGGLLGGLVKHAFELLKTKLDYQSGIFNDLLKERWAAYEQIWKISSVTPKWPKNEVTTGQLEETSYALRTWYFGKGGMLLSKKSRDLYTPIQECIQAILKDANGNKELKISDPDYDSIVAVFSKFRSELVEDLNSRERKFKFW